METGRRVWKCELSTIDSAFLFAGMLTAAAYFDRRHATTRPRSATLADALYRRADWDWAQHGGATRHARLEARDRLPPVPLGGLRRGAAALRARPRLADPPAARGELRRLAVHLPVEGDLRPRAISTPGRCSPTSSRTSGSTSAASRTPSCASRASTTSRTAGGRPTSSSEYAIRNPLEFEGYGEHCWGFTASDGPGLDELRRSTASSGSSSTTSRAARPFGPDDGTIAPWAVVASLPFAPEIVLPTIAHFDAPGPGHGRPVRLQGRRSTRRIAVDGSDQTAGCRPTTSASTRGRSC